MRVAKNFPCMMAEENVKSNSLKFPANDSLKFARKNVVKRLNMDIGPIDFKTKGADLRRTTLFQRQQLKQ